MGGKKRSSRGPQHHIDYRSVLDGLLEGCQIIGFDWKYLYVNDAAARYNRCSKEELLGRTMMEAYPGIEKTNVFSSLKECMRKRVCRLAEDELVLLNGTKGQFELRIQPVPEGIFILSHEVTERKKTEEALKESEERFRRLVKVSRDLIMLTDPEGTVIYLSPACKKVLGWDPESLVGLRPNIFHPDDKAMVESALRRALHGRSGLDLQYRIVGEDGKARWVSHSWFPVMVRGELRVVSSVVQDINERKKAEEALTKSEERYATTTKQTNAIIYDYNVKTGKITWAGSIRGLTGFSDLEFSRVDIGRWAKMIHPEDRAQATSELDKSMKSKTRYLIRYRFRKKSGEYFWAQDIGTFLYDSKGRAYRMLGVMRDVSELKKAEDAIKESEDRLLGIFNNASNCIAIYSAEKGGKDFIIQNFNQAAERVEKVKKEDIIGKRVTSVFPGVRKFGIFDVFRRVWKTGKPERFPSKIYKDKRISGWRDNYVFRLDSGEIVAIYSDRTKEKQAEEAIKESEEKYRALVNQSLEGIIIAQGPVTRIVFANPALAGMLGYSINELLSLPPGKITGLIHPEDRELFFGRFKKRLQGKAAPSHYEFRAVRKDKKIIWVAVSSNRITYYGQPAVQATFTDVTDRKSSEEALRKMNRTLELLSESNRLLIKAEDEHALLQGICEILVKQGGYRMAWFGVASNDPDKRVRPAAYAGFEKGFLKKVRISWGKNKWGCGPSGIAIRGGRPCSAANLSSDPRYSPWRSEAMKRGYASFISFPLIVEGKSIGVLNIYSGVPDAFDKEEIALLNELAGDVAYGMVSRRAEEKRAKAEEALQISEEKYRGLTENMNDVIYSLGANGALTYISPSVKQYGFDPKKMISRKFQEFVLPDDIERVTKEFRRSFKSGSEYSTVFRVRGKKGRIYWVEDNGKFQFDKSGTPISITGTLRDVTERKKLEDFKKNYTLRLESNVRSRTRDLLEQKRRAEALTEMKDRFIRDIGHELKTPLSIILGNLSLLKEIAPAGKEREWSKLLDMMDRNATRLGTSINKMLQLYKLAQTEPKSERIYLKEMVADIYSEYLPLAKMKEIELKAEAKPAVILGDGELIQLALSNLVSNAIKFTDHGSVSIELKPSEKSVSIIVSDTGKGLSPQNRKKLFEKFFKVDPSAPGTGIGLAITKEIVEKHKGEILVKTALGKGSTFTMVLPRGV